MYGDPGRGHSRWLPSLRDGATRQIEIDCVFYATGITTLNPA
jgi:hypothetical protein